MPEISKRSVVDRQRTRRSLTPVKQSVAENMWGVALLRAREAPLNEQMPSQWKPTKNMWHYRVSSSQKATKSMPFSYNATTVARTRLHESHPPSYACVLTIQLSEKSDPKNPAAD